MKILSRSSTWFAVALLAAVVVVGCSSSQDAAKKDAPADAKAQQDDPNTWKALPPQADERAAPPTPEGPLSVPTQVVVPPSTPPATEPPKKEEPKKEEPKKEEPKKEPAKTEEPKTEPAKTEPAKMEEPKPEASKGGDKSEEPKAEAPKTEEPKTEAPKTEASKTEAPKTEEPKTEAPKTEEPKPEAKSEAPKPLKQAELLVELPDHCNTPDGMTVLKDNSVIVSMPNFNDKSARPLLVRITPDNKVEDFYTLPDHPETGRMGPMGIRVAPNGDLYLADNQLFHHKDGKTFLYGKSRVVRISMKDGKPGKLSVVASGLNVANGIAIHDGYVYVTETILVPDSKPLVSGVFRFKLDGKPVKLKAPLEKDPHLVLTMETQSKIPFGADGICFDKKGNLYVSAFADAIIRKVVLGKDGKPTSNEIFAKADFMRSCDGMDYDPRTDKIYSADLMGNGIRAISMDGKVENLAQDADNDGSGGHLDAPAEAVVRGNTIVVANMDFPVEGSVNTKFDKPYTISVIKLD